MIHPSKAQLAIKAGDPILVVQDNGEVVYRVCRRAPWKVGTVYVLAFAGRTGGYSLTRCHPVPPELLSAIRQQAIQDAEAGIGRALEHLNDADHTTRSTQAVSEAILELEQLSHCRPSLQSTVLAAVQAHPKALVLVTSGVHRGLDLTTLPGRTGNAPRHYLQIKRLGEHKTRLHEVVRVDYPNELPKRFQAQIAVHGWCLVPQRDPYWLSTHQALEQRDALYSVWDGPK